MPDLSDFSIIRKIPANVNVPIHEINGRFLDSTTGEPLADYTGDNSLQWPAVIATLPVEQQDQLAQQIAMQILNWKAGL